MIRAPRSIAEDVWRDVQLASARAAKKELAFPGPPVRDAVTVIAAAIEAARAEPCSCVCPDCSPHPHGIRPR